MTSRTAERAGGRLLAGAGSELGQSLGAGGVTRLVRVPLGLAVVAEGGAAPGPATLETWAARAPSRDHRVPDAGTGT